MNNEGEQEMLKNKLIWDVIINTMTIFLGIGLLVYVPELFAADIAKPVVGVLKKCSKLASL